jgi:pimeloyl-ACP methyl ester carboxylesterase
LNGWFFESQKKPATATIIFCHGNGGNISSVGWMGQRFAKHGFNVLLFDYRGYGASEGVVADESGLSSASSVANTALPWLPAWLHFLGRNRFESARKLANVKSPILIAHGDPDQTIPTDEGRRLFAAANEPKKLLIVPGAGHVVFGSAGEPYLSQVEQFMREAIAKGR